MVEEHVHDVEPHGRHVGACQRTFQDVQEMADSGDDDLCLESVVVVGNRLDSRPCGRSSCTGR